MQDMIAKLKKKMRKIWLKLLRAEVHHEPEKVQKLQKKLIKKELKLHKHRDTIIHEDKRATRTKS